MCSQSITLVQVEEGGETHFTELGIKVAPKPGLAVMFYSTTPDGSLDRLTRHSKLRNPNFEGGCAVTKGQKWCATKWYREGNRKLAKKRYERRPALCLLPD